MLRSKELFCQKKFAFLQEFIGLTNMTSSVPPTSSALTSVTQSNTPPETTAHTPVINNTQPPELVAPPQP